MGSIHSQDESFYSTRWPKKVVDLVKETISREALYGDWDYKGTMATGLENAKACLKREFGVLYTDEEILEAIDLLHERFVVWGKLMNNQHVMINKCSKKVSTRPSVWEWLIKEDERVKWYGNEGEKVYDHLEVIFENPWKGKEDFVFLGEVTGLNNVPARFTDVEITPLHVYPTPPRGHTYIDDPSPTCPVDAANPNEMFLPNPQGTPGIRIISKDDYEKSLSAKSSKTTKKLFFVPDSPLSSVGSSNIPIESLFETLRTKFNRSG